MTLLLILIVVLVLVVISGYNNLQKLSQPVKQMASNVQVIISKKINMLNQLVEVVKNYQEAEQFTQLKIAQDNNDTAALIASYQQSGSLLTSIQGVADRFPNLKSSDQYQTLMHKIADCETDVQTARLAFNEAVKRYNEKRSSIPTVFISQFMGFSEARYLEFDIAGNGGGNILQGFKTDDGERLNKLLKSAGDKIGSAGKQLANQAESAGKMLSDKIKDMQTTQFYYMVPGGVPKGPLPLKEIEKQISEGSISPDIKVAEKGSEEWKEFAALKEME